MSDDPFKQLEDLLGECDLQLRVGLVAQGHIPTVERMLAEGRSWSEIGTAIGWDGETARGWYERHRVGLRIRWHFIQEMGQFKNRKWPETTCPVCGLEWTTGDPGGRCPAHRVHREMRHC